MKVKPKSKPNQKEIPTFNDKSCDRQLFFSQEATEVEFKAKYNFRSAAFSLSPTPALHIPENHIFQGVMSDVI